MCPACLASAALAAAGVISTGGVAALAATLLHSRKSAKIIPHEESKEKEK